MALVRFTRRPSRIGFPAYTGSSAFPTIEDVENRVNRFFERALNDPFGSALVPEAIGWTPAMDIVETSKELTLTAELPGMDQKDVDVSVEDGVVTIRGEKTEERKEEQNDKKVYLYERTYGSFQRSFMLPPSVDSSKITADFEKGVLKVHMPKDGEAKPKGRKIEVKSV
jgi:HSP20 family protein